MDVIYRVWMKRLQLFLANPATGTSRTTANRTQRNG